MRLTSNISACVVCTSEEPALRAVQSSAAHTHHGQLTGCAQCSARGRSGSARTRVWSTPVQHNQKDRLTGMSGPDPPSAMAMDNATAGDYYFGTLEAHSTCSYLARPL